MGILEGVASIFGGGLTGLLGTVIAKVADFKTKKLEMEMANQRFSHEVEMKKTEMQMAAAEAAARIEVTKIDAQGKTDVADAASLKAAIDAEDQPRLSDPSKITSRQEWLFVIVDAVKTMVRPGLTIYLCVLATMMYIQARSLMGSAMAPADAAALLREIVNTVLYLTTTCVLFWFGSRNSSSKKS